MVLLFYVDRGSGRESDITIFLTSLKNSIEGT